MSLRKTLGGDRLGSGKKMQVDLHGYERSTHDLGYVFRSTMSKGTLVPFFCEVGLPGDTFDINLSCEAMTHPTVGPLFGSDKVQLDAFVAPIRLYQGSLHNNKLGIGMKMADIKLPIIELYANDIIPDSDGSIDNAQINPSCILSYLGIRGVGTPSVNIDRTREFNGVPLLAYWDIYKNYYSNKQEEIGAVIHRPKEQLVQTVNTIKLYPTGTAPSEVTLPKVPPGTVITAAPLEVESTLVIAYTGDVPKPEQIILLSGQSNITVDKYFQTMEQGVNQLIFRNPFFNQLTVVLQGWNYINPDNVITDGEPLVTTFPLENIDTMREHILQNAGMLTAFNVSLEDYPPYNLLLKPDGNYHSKLASQEGLALKTYQSDLFNNWLSTEWIDGADGISAITAVDTSQGFFTIDTLTLSRKVYDLMNRIAVSGGTYDDWLDVVWDHERFTRCESPMYMGGLIKEIVYQEVISNSATDADGGQPLGTLAGRGIMGNKHKGGSLTIKIDEPSYIIMIVSITPRVDYSQGNKWDVNLKTMDDFHKPALDQIGFQELITEQMAWWDTWQNGTTGVWETKSAGKQPAWLNYMTNVNQVRGNFAIEGNEMFMTLNRRYEKHLDPAGAYTIKDLTTYIDPVKFNHIFAETARDAQNYWMQIGIDCIARRKMSAKVMPNL